jgi:hypothetical protein
MPIVYALGGYVKNRDLELGAVNGQELASKFENGSLIDFFWDEKTARDFQTKSSATMAGLAAEKCRVLFQVQIELGSRGIYVSRLIKASFSSSNSLQLDYSLKPMVFLLTPKQCKTLGIDFKLVLDKVTSFLFCNRQVEEPTSSLLPEINNKIINYYNQLTFFKEEPPKESTLDSFAESVKNFFSDCIKTAYEDTLLCTRSQVYLM